MDKFEVTLSVHWPSKEKLDWICLSTNIISFIKMAAGMENGVNFESWVVFHVLSSTQARTTYIWKSLFVK